ncbi:glycosyltransferase, group 1 family protein [Enterococcus faecalis 13-SD-W-01]|nr:glycosyltransferase, group 1 family protein [Enterococcus faecalis 13-SD-W-01]
MNILIVGPSPVEKGGMATVVKNFLTKYMGENDFYLYDTWRRKKKNRLFLGRIFNYRKTLKKQNIDIVHFHVAEKGSFFRKSILLLLTPKRIKTIFHFHAAEFDSFYSSQTTIVQYYIHFIMDKANLIVSLDQTWREFYSTLTKTTIKIIPNGVELSTDIHYDTSSSDIITLGRIGRRKGSFDILKIAQAMQKINPKIQFHLYGDGGEEKVKVLSLIEKHSLKNIHIHGWSSDTNSLFKKAAIHLLPSYKEGLPMSILESMANGVPNISTFTGGIPE